MIFCAEQDFRILQRKFTEYPVRLGHKHSRVHSTGLKTMFAQKVQEGFHPGYGIDINYHLAIGSYLGQILEQTLAFLATRLQVNRMMDAPSLLGCWKRSSFWKPLPPFLESIPTDMSEAM